MSPRRILLAALAAAAWTALFEAAPLFLEARLGVMVRLGRGFVWMTPLGQLILFGLAALVLIALGTRWARASSRPAVVGTFAALATATLLPERLHPLAVLLLAVGVGVQAGRMTRKPPKRTWLLPTVALAGVLLVLVPIVRRGMGEQAWRQTWLEWLPAPRTGAPNVLLLILDTVRAASLDLGGDASAASDWPSVRAPVLEGLAARSMVFTHAIAPSPWTLPSHASMFTGRWPTELWAGRPAGAEWTQALDGRYPTVAEALARSGYRTGAFVANLTFAAAETGLDRGFLDYEDYPASLGQIALSTGLGRRIAGWNGLRGLLGWHELLDRKRAEGVADEFLSWQARSTDARPFFAFLNFFDAHEPYFPPDSVIRRLPPGTRWSRFEHYSGVLTGEGAARTDKWAMTSDERVAHASAYDAAILDVDRAVGRILAELERRGVLDNTIVIVAGDHGEQLGEHGLYNHDNSLYLTTLHVPLIVHDPRRSDAPARVRNVVTLRDLGATILDLAGLDPAAMGLGGASLLRFEAGVSDSITARSTADPPAFSTLSRGAKAEAWYPVLSGPAMYSLVDSAFHYLRNGDGSEELFDLRRDPREDTNLAGEPAAGPTLEAFRAALREIVPDAPLG